MALVSQGFLLTIKFVGTNTSRTVTRKIPLASADFATATTDAATALGYYQAASGAEVKGYTLSEVFYEDSPSYPANCQLSDVVVLAGNIDGDITKPCKITIPGVVRVSGLFVQDIGDEANTADLTNAVWTNVWGLYQTGGPATLSDGEKAGALLSGHLISQQSSNP